ncbi:MAG: pyridoxal-phosphate dependent enzyme [Candidatus Zixiibacteriota bacterium]|nr:MAG: pyridoxal-phosphate dependent enzyme [candidate division Zixibacteria bacterium]
MDTPRKARTERVSLPQRGFLSDITEAIGDIPLVRLRRMTVDRGVKATVLVKPEFLNPTGSIKDRMAVYVLRRAVASGELKPGGTIVEATSGNTGAAVAMFAAAYGYRAILTIPDKMSREKVDTLRAFGAEVHVCPTAVPPDSPESYYETGKRLYRETPGSYWVGQYFNVNNIEAHYKITGPEIWEQTDGKIDCLVGGIGTGGTISGTARYLKEQNAEVEIVAVDPEGSVYYQYHVDQTLIEPHTYLVEGIGEDMLCPTIDFSVIDRIYKVTDKEAFVAGRELTRAEGIFGGGSSGAAVHAALKHAKTLDENKMVVVILPDSGMKYITKMFNDDWMREKGLLD